MGKWLPGFSRRSQARIQDRVSRLGARMAATPRPEFNARLREQLTQSPPGEDVPEQRPAGPRHSRRRSRPGLLPRLLSIAMVAAMVVSGMWTYRSMPGDTFYPLKRAAERTLFHLSSDDAERADRSFGYAETRAREVKELLGSGEGEGEGEGEREEVIGETLQAMADTTRSAVTSLRQMRRRDSASAKELKRFVQKQRTQIAGMIPKMGAENQRKAHVYLNYIEGLAPPG